MQIISRHSGMEGFTFPGIIEEPSWTSGIEISASPAFGPIFISLMSLEMFRRFTAKDRSDAEKFRKVFMLLAISVRFFAAEKLIFVRSERFLIINFWYPGAVFMPVPTAVPPIPRIFNLLACSMINSRDF